MVFSTLWKEKAIARILLWKWQLAFTRVKMYYSVILEWKSNIELKLEWRIETH